MKDIYKPKPFRFHNGIKLNVKDLDDCYLDPYEYAEDGKEVYSHDYLYELMDDNTKALLWVANNLYSFANRIHDEKLLHMALGVIALAFDDRKFTVKMSCFDRQRPSQELQIELTIYRGEMLEEKTSRSSWAFLCSSFDGVYLINIHGMEIIVE